jgi:ABC-type bacteriocin/lantibiotic exporter with double-glycine peptidase domain
MPKRWLTIEHRPQEVDAGCLAACVQMALAHLDITVPQKALNRLLELTPAGIPVSRLVRLDRYGVRVELLRGTLDDLIHAIDQGVPPIVFVRTDPLPYWSLDTQHALLISGYDGDDLLINDPAFPTAPQQVGAASFCLAWDEFDNRYAVLGRTD